MYGGKFAFQKQLGWLVVGRKFVILHFWIRGQIPSTSPSGGLYSEGRFNGGTFLHYCSYLEELIFGILRYALSACANKIFQKRTIFMFTKS